MSMKREIDLEKFDSEYNMWMAKAIISDLADEDLIKCNNGNFPNNHNKELIFKLCDSYPYNLFSICTTTNLGLDNFNALAHLKILKYTNLCELVKSICYYIKFDYLAPLRPYPNDGSKIVAANICIHSNEEKQYCPIMSMVLCDDDNLIDKMRTILYIIPQIPDIRLNILLYCINGEELEKSTPISRSELNDWRKEVIEDKCVCCGSTKHLEAHHIYGFNDYNDLADDPNNGITLCKFCHKKYHSEYGRDNANPKDLIEFIQRFTSIQRLE